MGGQFCVVEQEKGCNYRARLTLRLRPRPGSRCGRSDERSEPSERSGSRFRRSARFGYKQELKRSLGGIQLLRGGVQLHLAIDRDIHPVRPGADHPRRGVHLDLAGRGLGQFIVALKFAEVSSHYPVAGSVFQWTKYLAGRTYSWFAGWIYLFAGILTVTAVVATLPLALIPALNGLGWHLAERGQPARPADRRADHAGRHHGDEHLRGEAGGDHQQHRRAVRDPRHVRVRAGAGGLPQPPGPTWSPTAAGLHVDRSSFLAAMFMSLFVIYGFDTASTLAEETRDPAATRPRRCCSRSIGAFIIGGVFLLGTLVAIPNLHARDQAAASVRRRSSRQTSPPVRHAVPAGGLGGDLRLLPVDHGRDDPAVLRDVRDDQLPVSGRCPGESPAAHAGLGSCVAIAVLAAIPFLKYSGAGDHRDRGYRHDLPELLPRQHGDHAGSAARLAEGAGAVPARAGGACW